MQHTTAAPVAQKQDEAQCVLMQPMQCSLPGLSLLSTCCGRALRAAHSYPLHLVLSQFMPACCSSQMRMHAGCCATERSELQNAPAHTVCAQAVPQSACAHGCGSPSGLYPLSASQHAAFHHLHMLASCQMFGSGCLSIGLITSTIPLVPSKSFRPFVVVQYVAWTVG
jgi:hypothetical protein